MHAAMQAARLVDGGRGWYHLNRLDELIRMHPTDRVKMECRKWNQAPNENFSQKSVLKRLTGITKTSVQVGF